MLTTASHINASIAVAKDPAVVTRILATIAKDMIVVAKDTVVITKNFWSLSNH